MAANSKSTQRIASLGKRFVTEIWTPNSSRSSFITRRAAHASAYDKNVDEQAVHASAVPDDVIQPESDKYWAPHPQTGVFGPATEQQHSGAGVDRASNCDQGSVLEEKAWFRPTSLEDLEKPHHI
ncbi:late embryogenesis abundant protein At5g17165-like [Euphorbia lathyris]|uniref:late embryogenesis abundant protein At5g17165-like n=1 Tax=Euphorbia lathyris TaxID=212925 RepID=UPI0033141244